MSAETTPSADYDWPAIREQSQAAQTPEWRAQFGEHAWEAALIVFGEFSPADLDTLSPEEREHYALAPKADS